MLKPLNLLTVLIMLVLPVISSGQNLLENPESIVFDSIGNRYLVSNWTGGKTVEIDENGTHSYFRTGLGECHALHIHEGILYIGRSNSVMGINLATGSTEMLVFITQAQMIKGLTTDTSGFLYATNWGTSKSIFKIRLSTQTVSTLVSFSHNIIGIIFDEHNNRLLVPACESNSSIRAVSLPDGSITTVCTTTLDRPFGITRDSHGYYYISAWGSNSVYRLDSAFADPPELISNQFTGPEGLIYNQRDEILAVPNWDINHIDFLEMYVSVESDTSLGEVPFEVNLSGVADLDATNWIWSFGDGDSAFVQSPSHTYMSPGLYDVTLSVEDALGGIFIRNAQNRIAAVADTVKASDAGSNAGGPVEVLVYVTNTLPAYMLKIPIEYGGGDLGLTLDSTSTAGLRTEYLGQQLYQHSDPGYQRLTIKLAVSTVGGTQPLLAPGDGPVVKLYFSLDGSAMLGESTPVELDGYSSYLPVISTMLFEDYQPVPVSGVVDCNTCCKIRGDLNRSGGMMINDLTYLVDYLFSAGAAPVCSEEGDLDSSGEINISDLTYFVAYLFGGGEPPSLCY